MIECLDQEHINILLETQCIGRLACSANDQPYVVPITYVYENGHIYGHTNDGMKARMLRQNPKVCFEIDTIEDITNWRSVIVFGRFEELQGEEAAKALDLMLNRITRLTASEKLGHGEDLLHNLARYIKLNPTKGITYRIQIDEKFGRYERH